VSAYLSSPARPLLLVADTAELQATDPAQLKGGQCALFTAAGANYRKLASWDPLSTDAHDGTTVWRPTAIGVGDPGRFVVLGTSASTPNTYALRDGSGNIAGAGGSDFAARVAHVNWATGANDPVPTLICGLSVDRGSSGGVERARSGIFWVEGSGEVVLAQDTAGDDTTISAYLPLRAAGLRAPSGEASAGFVRMSQGDEIRSKLGGTSYRLLAGLSGPVVALGDSAVANTTVDAASDVTITSQSAGVGVRTPTSFTVKDQTGTTTLIDASVGGSYVRAFGRFTALNGGTAVLDVVVASGIVKANGRLQVYDPTSTTLLLDADTGISPTTVAVYGLLDEVRAGIAATATAGTQRRNTTASTVGVPIQYAPSDVDEGRVRVSGADRAMRFRRTVKPRTSGALDVIYEFDTGSGYSEAYRFTTSTAGQFVAALQSYALAFSNGGVFHDGTNNGIFINGADNAMHLKNRQGKGLWYSDEDLEVQTGGANQRVYFDSTGDLMSVLFTELRLKQLTSQIINDTWGTTVTIDWGKGINHGLVADASSSCAISASGVLNGGFLFLTIKQNTAATCTFNSSQFEHATFLAAQLGTTTNQRTNYWFAVAPTGKLTPIAVMSNVAIP